MLCACTLGLYKTFLKLFSLCFKICVNLKRQPGVQRVMRNNSACLLRLTYQVVIAICRAFITGGIQVILPTPSFGEVPSLARSCPRSSRMARRLPAPPPRCADLRSRDVSNTAWQCISSLDWILTFFLASSKRLGSLSDITITRITYSVWVACGCTSEPAHFL